eukprot:5533646-Pyramimonas_sp.AAC.1
MVVDMDPNVPEGPIQLRQPCCLRHPGLCQTEHAHVYEVALGLATSLRRQANALDSGDFLYLAAKAAELGDGTDEPD